MDTDVFSSSFRCIVKDYKEIVLIVIWELFIMFFGSNLMSLFHWMFSQEDNIYEEMITMFVSEIHWFGFFISRDVSRGSHGAALDPSFENKWAGRLLELTSSSSHMLLDYCGC